VWPAFQEVQSSFPYSGTRGGLCGHRSDPGPHPGDPVPHAGVPSGYRHPHLTLGTLEQDHGPLKGKSRFAVQELPSDPLCVYLEGKE
jgi:hypothetical protein